MKRIIAVIVILTIFSASSAKAFADTGKSTGSIGTYVTIAEESIRNAYEASVIGRLAGRCGMTPSGAKGLIFEVKCADKLNLKNIFNNDFTAKLSYCPNDTMADLVAYNSSGQNVEYFQCKDVLSSSGIYDTYTRISEGQYTGATLIGTTESAESFNAYASKNAMTTQMVDSGISSKTTSRIADKSLGNIRINNALSTGLNAGALNAGINSVVALVECLINQKDFYDSFGHVTIQSIKGFATGFSTGFAVEIAGSAVLAAGGSAVTMFIIPTVVCVGTGMLSCYVLDKVIKNTDIENTVAKLTREFGDSVADYASKINDKAVQIGNEIKEKSGPVAENIKEKVVQIGETIKEKADQSTEAIKEFSIDAKESIVNAAEEVSSTISNTTEKAIKETKSFFSGLGKGIANTFGKITSVAVGF